MKVPGSVRRLYDDQREINLRLRDHVQTVIAAVKDPRWHYEGRIKSLQSFALKIESGRIREPHRLEDFFASTLVVANIAQVQRAEAILTKEFQLLWRKPKLAARTHKSTDAFPFDDLRLYLQITDPPSLPASGVAGIPFEIQLKTFLQHAWSIATHDLVYKTDDVNWSKERIAYQIKAMLEHAELSILEAEVLSRSPAVAKENDKTEALRQVIAVVKQNWSTDELPVDVRRLAENITAVLKGIGINAVRLGEILASGKASGGGAHPSNLSPFCAVLHHLLAAERHRLLDLMEKGETRVFVPAELEIPDTIDRTSLRNAVFIPNA